VSQTKPCYLLKVEIFAPKSFELVTPRVQCLYSIHMEQGASTWLYAHGSLPEVAGVTLSDSTHVLKFSNMAQASGDGRLRPLVTLQRKYKSEYNEIEPNR